MQEEELLKWEIGTLTTRQRSYRAPSRLKILSNRAFAYLLESVSSAFLASNAPVYGPFLAPDTCHESQFSHLRPLVPRQVRRRRSTGQPVKQTGNRW